MNQELSSDSLIRLCGYSDFGDEDKIQVEIDGYDPFAVYRIEERYFVTEDTCTHAFASLAEEGEIVGFEIECGWHNGRFDVRTGEATKLPCRKALKAYPVVLIDGSIYIRNVSQ